MFESVIPAPEIADEYDDFDYEGYSDWKDNEDRAELKRLGGKKCKTE